MHVQNVEVLTEHKVESTLTGGRGQQAKTTNKGPAKAPPVQLCAIALSRCHPPLLPYFDVRCNCVIVATSSVHNAAAGMLHLFT